MRPSRIGYIILIVIVVVVAAVAWFVHYPEIAALPSPPKPASFDTALVNRGAMLAGLGDCAVCHTAANGAAYAGGRPIETPFGIIYSSNITPDSDTGIGQWSEAAFQRSMSEGVDRRGQYLYPAFPYNHFTEATDDDIKAIYAFLMTRAPAKADHPANKLPFPLNVRPIMAGWNLFFLRKGPYQPDSSKSDAWNRGAYLAEGLGHCSSCHTPKNFLGAEKGSAMFAGDRAEDWDAPALNADAPAPAGWTADDLATYLKRGHQMLHGQAAGPMAEVLDGLSRMPQADVAAIATYAASFMPEAKNDAAATLATAEAHDYGPTHVAANDAGADEPGAAIFATACAICHHAGGGLPVTRPVSLSLSTTVALKEPTNFVHIVLEGIPPADGAPAAIMPPFADVLTDQQIADLAAYVRKHFTDKTPWNAVDAEAARIRSADASGTAAQGPAP